MSKVLEFEKPIIELRKQIAELRKFSEENKLDLSHEIYVLVRKVKQMERQIYENLSPWQRVSIARWQERPTSLDYIERLIDNFIEFHGDRYYGDDRAIIGGIGSFEGRAVTVIGHQKGKNTKENLEMNFGMPNPEGYRKALRLMKQAEKFNRPIITFIDTPGAYCGLGAEERGQGEAIALNLLEMSRLKTPIIAIIIGEGGSGGALALGVGDRVGMLENSIYSVISPEGLASILWKDASRAEEGARVMRLTAQDLLDLKIIDNIIKEARGGAHKDYDFTANKIKSYISKSLEELKGLDRDELLANRYKKFRNMGIWK
ncbi:MAG: acetyl-CoA carboxylase carboxyltransferase subunit alpha [Tissierellaceae bacterium]|jgi:acetyl-CoA carboxylase carboxyl transferase subunit alpha|nr:acetyl-CoA carboxylase carboxyltransferase subunit alpha [Tissierellia bacterium]